jgi:hypothetical protein
MTSIRKLSRYERLLRFVVDKLYWYLEGIEDRRYDEIEWDGNVGRRKLGLVERRLMGLQARLWQHNQAVNERMWASHHEH